MRRRLRIKPRVPNIENVEVVFAWGDSPERAEVFREARPIRIGTDPKADFCLPREALGVGEAPSNLLGAGDAAFTLLEPVDGRWRLHVPPGASFIAERIDGTRTTTRDETATDHPNPVAILLDAETRARVIWGDFVFFVRAGFEAEAPPRSVAFDARAAGYIAAGLVFHGLLLGMFLLSPPAAGALSVNMDSDRSRYLRVQLDALARERDEMPVELPDTGGPSGSEGQAMQGEEGTAGAPETRRSTGGQVAVRGESTNRRLPLTRAEVSQLATLQVIGAATARLLSQVSSPFGDASATGFADADFYGNLLALNGGMSPGSGGFGMSNAGRGGCPAGAANCGVGTVGVGNYGTIGMNMNGCSSEEFARIEGSQGRSAALERCSGVPRAGAIGRLEREGRVPGRIRMEAAETMGGLRADDVRRVVHRSLSQIKFCYQQELIQRPELAGRLSVRFVIQPSGAVMTSAVAQDDLRSGDVAQCVTQAVSRWSFPQATGVTVVTYPFRFESP